ncbi:MAG: penicillin acylase family protein [Woeseiaceae bacterium]|nr:penicillin acylase family protein [Woeseiaceae bacterium]
MLKRLTLICLLLVLLLPLAAYLALRASLPQLDGEFTVSAITAPVSIERDAYGVPVVTAQNRVDLAYATGFVHGQDRFFQMDLSRRRAAGELAELFGAVALPLDRRNRFHRFRNRARAAIADLVHSESELLSAYAAGVNAGLTSLDARPFEYLLLRARPQAWQAEDSLLVGYSMFLELNDDLAERDRQRGRAHRVLPRPLFDFLYPHGSDWDAPLEGPPVSVRSVPTATEVGEFLDDHKPVKRQRVALPDVDIPGSNNWAVAGWLTDSGRAIVANDMHLPITAPGVFYRARLRVVGDRPLDLTGVTLPGVPMLIAGSNGSIAWANTNSYGDWTDAVLLQPGEAADSYLTAAGSRRFTTYLETIHVRDGGSEELRIRETIWGPVLEGNDEALIAVNWLAHKPGALNFRGLDLETATTAEVALGIANRMGMPPQNFVVGDASGNIGWTIAGRVPARADYDASLPADWSERAGWSGWLRAADYPRIVNPQSGRIWTANTRVVADAALARIGDGGYDLGARAGQIRDALLAKERFTIRDMLDIQLDDRALFLARWQARLLATLDDAMLADDPQLREYRRLVENWGARAAVESVGYRLVRDFRSRVRDRVFDMLMQPVRARFGAQTPLRMSNQFEAPLWSLINEQPAHLLGAQYPSWDALLRAAIREALDAYRDEFDGPLTKRNWGERNTVQIRHPLSAAVPALSRWLDMPRDALPGDSNMPRVQGPGFGASERFAVAPGDEAHGYLHMPAGQSGHPLSPYYRRGHDDWVRGRASPFLPGAAAHTLVLRPQSAD